MNELDQLCPPQNSQQLASRSVAMSMAMLGPGHSRSGNDFNPQN
jgi:hypothetical protein